MLKAPLPKLRSLLALVAVTVIATGFLAWRHFRRDALDWTRVEAQTLTILKSEPLAFLVTDRLVTQVIVESRDYSLLLGQREGYLVATVRLYYGVDLTNLTPAHLHRTDGKIVVTVPEPEELDFAVDLPSLRFVSKRNVTVALADWLQGRDLESELRTRLRAEALGFMNAEQVIPQRSAIVARLNRWAPVLSGALGVEIRFE